jgi:[ribosomal protein S18]-alanine N-acetyltransferase
MSAATIRRGTPADIAQVMAVASHSETAAQWRAADYDQIFSSSRMLLVAEDEPEKRIVGFVIAHDIAGEWELENIAVAADHQRHGIGRQLVSKLFRVAQSNGAKCIFLEVRESNLAARKLYESCGFQQYGHRRAYYVNPSEDAVLYRFLCNPAALENC